MNQTQFNQNASTLKSDLQSELMDAYEATWEQFSQDNNIPSNYDPAMPTRLTDLQLEGYFEELEAYALDSDVDDPREIVQSFLSETIAPDDYVLEVEREFNGDTAYETAYEEMVLDLKNTEPFGNATDGFWERSVRSATTNYSDLFKYQGNVAEFVENFIPDWEETAYEI
jgi:hypothetical protein